MNQIGDLLHETLRSIQPKTELQRKRIAFYEQGLRKLDAEQPRKTRRKRKLGARNGQR